MWPLIFGLGWLAAKESEKEAVYILHHVTRGGCMKEFDMATRRCRHDDHRPNADACIKATAALRKCFAARPDWFGDCFTDRIDSGLDQDTNPTPEEIRAYRRQGKYRWWTGMRRS
ncbi:hypothetical protein ACQ4PT_027825 [Festuca glaucescens]